MKAIKTSELKNNLSRYLRRAKRGERITVLDRSEPVAELVPPHPETADGLKAMEREGTLIVGTQDWENLTFRPTRHRVAVRDLLDATREDAV